VHELGFSTNALALFMSTFIAGGALIQWPLGRWSDRFDRRWIIAGVCAIACVTGIGLAVLGGTSMRASFWLFVLIAIFGAAMLPVYSLSIAHANDRLPRSEFVEASAGLLLINALASILGPVLGSLVILGGGNRALFLYTALVHGAMVIFAVTRILTKGAPEFETRDRFEPVPQGSPASLPLDPRAPEHASSR
jgi:MFS family permease